MVISCIPNRELETLCERSHVVHKSTLHDSYSSYFIITIIADARLFEIKGSREKDLKEIEFRII